MGLHRIDYDAWPRRAYFEHYARCVPCTYSMTANVDVTVLLPWLKERKLRFYPALIWAVSAVVNDDPALCMELDETGIPGVHDRMDPSYTVFRPESETFTSVWTAYTPSLEDFCRAWAADSARWGGAAGPAGRPPQPGQGLFNISAVPWVSFTGFNLNLQKGYDYLPPIFTVGKYRDVGGRVLLPVAAQVHHGAADGFHVGRFFSRLQTWAEAPRAEHPSKRGDCGWIHP